MDLEFFILGGYGQFVWSAFTFTFVSCVVLYIETKKELQKQEKVFLNKFGRTQAVKTGTVNKEKALSSSPIF